MPIPHLGSIHKELKLATAVSAFEDVEVETAIKGRNHAEVSEARSRLNDLESSVRYSRLHPLCVACEIRHGTELFARDEAETA
jgi:hypothetical protein